MSFVPYWSRTRLRTTWGSSLALVLIIGVVGGTTLALAAGGLRTDSAYPRFAAQYRGADATMYQYSNGPDMVAALAKVVRLPQVTAYGRIQGYDQENGTTVGAPLGPGFEHTVGVPRLLSGRLPTAPDEVALDWTVANQLHQRVGDTYRATLLSNENGSSVTYPLRVVGIAANTLNFPPYSADGASGVLLVASSFMTAHEAELGQPSIGIEVRLRGGQTAVPAFARAVVGEFRNAPMIVQGSALQTTAIENAIHPAAIALWLLGGSLALVAMFVLFQLFGRLSAVEEDPYATALALGATRRQLAGVELARTGVDRPGRCRPGRRDGRGPLAHLPSRDGTGCRARSRGRGERGRPRGRRGGDRGPHRSPGCLAWVADHPGGRSPPRLAFPPAYELERVGLVASVALAPARGLDGCRAWPAGRKGSFVGAGPGIGGLAGDRLQRIGGRLDLRCQPQPHARHPGHVWLDLGRPHL